MGNPVLFEDELRKLLLSGAEEKGLQFKQFKRILTSLESEDLLTWNAFRPLITVDPKSKWLTPIFKKAFGSDIPDGSLGAFREEDLNSAELENLRDGKVLLIYKNLQTSVSLSLPEYVAYKIGNLHIPRLAEINDRISKNKNYFKNL